MKPPHRELSFRPVLYLATWISTLVIIVCGDFTSFPEIQRDDSSLSLFWIWGGLSLVAPAMALYALRMAYSQEGKKKYRGIYWRFGADCIQFISVLTYTVMRLSVGDFHIYTMGISFAICIYTFHQVIFGAQELVGVEELAYKLRREKA